MPSTPDNPAIIDQHFNRVDQGSNEKCKTYECAYCSKRYAMNVTRMKLHLKSCSQCPVSVKKTLQIKRHKSSLQAAFMKGELMASSPNVYEHIIKMEHPNHELIETDDSSLSGQHIYAGSTRESVTFVDLNPDDTSEANESQQDQERHSVVYQHYTKLAEKPNDKCVAYECNYCNKKYAKNVTRMKLHLISCSKCPPNVQKSFKIKRHLMAKVDMSRSAVDMYESMGYGNNTEFVEVGDNQETMDFSNVLNSIRKLSKRETTVIWTLMARACYASGTSFDFIENPYWISCLKKIRPSLALPTSQHLSTSLLDNEYAYLRRTVEERLNSASSLCLQIYGWSNTKDDSIINVIIITPSGPILYKTMVGGNSRHGSKYLTQLVQTVFEKVGAEKFISVMTDNAKNTPKVSQIITNKKSSSIAFYCCASLMLSLLLQDICKIEPIKNIINMMTNVIRKLKTSLTLRNIYTVICSQIDNEKPLELIPPLKSRRDSVVASLESFISNETNLKTLAVNEGAGAVLESTADYILDHDFWLGVKTVYDLLKPITEIISIVENDENTLSVLPVLFQTVKKHLNAFIPRLAVKMEFEANDVFSAFEERKSLSLHSIHYAANLLDPRTRGEALNGDEIIEGISYISSLAPVLGVNKTEVISDLALYRTKQGLWSKAFVWDALESQNGDKSLPSVSWWNGICSSSPLAKLASAILLSPVTVHASEKHFKSYTLSHAKAANNLPNSRAAKLVFITHNLRSMDEEAVKYNTQNTAEENQPQFGDEDQYMETDEIVDEVGDIEEVEEIMPDAGIQILPHNMNALTNDDEYDSDVSVYVYEEVDDSE